MKKILITLGSDRTAAYAEAVQAAGAEPVTVDSTMKPREWRTAFSRCSGLLLSGGGDVACERYGLKLSAPQRKQFICGVDMARDEMESELAHKAVKMDMPIFAICRGIQLLNVALGGTLLYDVTAQLGDGINHRAETPDERMELAHAANWRKDARLLRDLRRDYPQVNSSHHQALDRVAPLLTPIAFAPDGVIEAVENADATFLVGVQFHPERLFQKHPEFLKLFQLFVKRS